MRTNSSKDIVNYVSNAIFWAVGELKEYVPVGHHTQPNENNNEVTF